MKANELMIGDWVRVTEKADKEYFYGEYNPGEIVQVNEILDYGINPYWCVDEVNYLLHLEDIEPIPLTKEILEANEISYKMGLGGYPVLEVHGVNCSVAFNLIKYVHQLQHALRLCGIDKEITIK